MKRYLEFTVDLKPFQTVLHLLEDLDLKSSLVFEDYKIADSDEKEISILVFEKFFLRAGNTAALTITVDNFGGDTIVKCIFAGNGEGLLDIDWGVGKSIMRPVKDIMESHIIEITKEI